MFGAALQRLLTQRQIRHQVFSCAEATSLGLGWLPTEWELLTSTYPHFHFTLGPSKLCSQLYLDTVVPGLILEGPY